jgi:1-acyl-sn-glycerol-3-phosphate acyltransferase
VTGTIPAERASRGDLNGWWRAGAPLAAAIVRLLFRVRVAGIHHVPLDGPAILAFAHVSVLDGPCLAVEVAWRRRRATRFLVAAEIFAQHVSGWFLRRYRQIPIRRGTGDGSALDAAIDALRDGSVVAIAPEGTVNPAPGEIQRIRTGISRIVLPSTAPVIPVGVWGTHRRWPKSGKHLGPPWRPTLALSFGPPIDPEGDAADQDDLDRFAATVGEALERHLLDARRLAGDPV